MIHILECPPGASLTSVPYSFLKPARLLIRNAASTESLIGYGIGEKINVLEPSVQYLIASHRLHVEIPLANGGFIIEWPADLSVQRVYE